jgi:hypothetical protein
MIARLRRLAARVRSAVFGDPPLYGKVHYYGADSPREAAIGLSQHGRLYCQRRGTGAWTAVVGPPGALHRQLRVQLRRLEVPFRELEVAQLLALPEADRAGLAVVLFSYPGMRDITAAARQLLGHASLAHVPFEYAAGLDPERASFARLDEYRDTWFIAPALMDPIEPYRIYEESLGKFEQKCGLRDFLDLYQLLRHVHRTRVPGDIAEFGSFRGHSGYLIAQVLRALGSDKRVFLFDTFEHFPAESLGVDAFWSGTHGVDFESVRAKFQALPNVTLVKGDFTQTLAGSGLAQVALAYVDCDSYRATRYLIEQVFESRLAHQGVMAFEDYGHLALLGNRLAVDEGLGGARAGFHFFSQFSGLYIVVKA